MLIYIHDYQMCFSQLNQFRKFIKLKMEFVDKFLKNYHKITIDHVEITVISEP